MQQVNLGMIGGGTVGSGVFHALQRNGPLMASRLGIKIHLLKIAVKAFDEPRPYEIPRSYLTTDWTSVVQDPQVRSWRNWPEARPLRATSFDGAEAGQTGHHRQ